MKGDQPFQPGFRALGAKNNGIKAPPVGVDKSQEFSGLLGACDFSRYTGYLYRWRHVVKALQANFRGPCLWVFNSWLILCDRALNKFMHGGVSFLGNSKMPTT